MDSHGLTPSTPSTRHDQLVMEDWLKERRGTLSLMATFVSTATFAVIFNPPGGVVPVPLTGIVKNCIAYNKTDTIYCPGEAILSIIYPNEYFYFLLFDMICLCSSLVVSYLLMSGMSLNHKVYVWLLQIGTCITIGSLFLTFIIAVTMTTPNSVLQRAGYFLEWFIYAWVGVFSIMFLYYTLHLVTWVVIFFLTKSKCATTPENTSEIEVASFV